jgi:hypothetical protein
VPDYTVELVQHELTVTLDTATPINILLTSQQGPAGAPGGGGGGQYTHTQASAATEWVINHNLGVRPNVTVMTAGGAEMWAEVLHTSTNQARAYFDTATSGIAVCS